MVVFGAYYKLENNLFSSLAEVNFENSFVGSVDISMRGTL
jgi:hypothetical protein